MALKLNRVPHSTFSIALALLVTATCAAQAPHIYLNGDKIIQAVGWSHFDKLNKLASVKQNEGRDLLRQKKLGAAEAAFNEAIEVFKNAPFAQIGVRENLAWVYLEEGQCDLALDTWLPSYHPKNSDAGMCCGIALAYARTARAEAGARVLKALYERDKSGIDFCSAAALPIAEKTDSKTVEATALMLLAWLRPTHLDESQARLEKAERLVPRNAAIQFALGGILLFREQRSWAICRSHFLNAYLWGDPKIHRAAGLYIQSNGEKLPAGE